MKKSKELKIRDSVKAVYSLYSEVKDFIFTTYNYEPDFFDEHIISYLMGFDKKISTIGELQDADKWIVENHLSVYYDKGALSVGTSYLTVPVFPQNNKTGGVFHPKVIVIYGKLKEGRNKKSVHLFVSSCNLTVSGYGRNMEAFSCIQVTSKIVAKSLIEFLETLDGYDRNQHIDLIKYLDSITLKDNSIEFLWSNKNSGIKLIDYLSDFPKGDLNIVSPYFDENGPKSLLYDLINRDKTTIIPALEGDNYNIHLKDYLDLKDNNIGFAVLANEDESRFIHAKIIQFGKKVIIGSYNFTTAAMRGINAEAALLFHDKSDLRLYKLEVIKERFLPDDEAISNRDETKNGKSNIFTSVTVDWKENKIFILSENLKEASYSLQIDGLNIPIISELTEKEEINITREIASHLLHHKTFSVYEENKVCFKGLINEISALECRPEFGYENLSESISEWFSYTKNDENTKQSLRLIDSDDKETEKILGVSQQKKEDIFDNYYVVAKAFENLIRQILISRSDSLEKAPKAQIKTEKYWKEKADKNLYGYLVKKPGSIENILTFLQKEHYEKQNKDIIYEWLVLNYIKSAISLFPENLVHNEINKIYTEKIREIHEKLNSIERDISNIISSVVGKKYMKWIEKEFNNRNNNV